MLEQAKCETILWLLVIANMSVRFVWVYEVTRFRFAIVNTMNFVLDL